VGENFNHCHKNKNEVFAEWWKLVGNSGWAVLVRGWRKLKVE
jgi:hypothetical protein